MPLMLAPVLVPLCSSDGTVREVTADAMFILQDVNDPLSVQKKREVKKLLRPAQEAQ